MKIKKLIIKFVMFFFVMFSFTACNFAPKEMVGRYNLTEIKGIPGVSVNTYEYNYIELKSDLTYHLENKAFNQITAQDGTWTYDKSTQELTFICHVNESTYSKDIATYNPEAKTFTLKSTVDTYSVSFTFTLEVTPEAQA